MLTVESVHLYYGASHILRGVSLAAERGKVMCLLGRNGVGKTSLLRAITGLQAIRGGRILWDGQDVSGMPPHERARIGFGNVPQGREIFPRLTVKENLETGFAAVPKDQKAEVAAELFAMFPVLEKMLGRRGGDLSGGQQQQLAIARALVTRPKVLLLDEPTEGIQPSIIKDIGRAISALREKAEIAIVLVEQYFDFARELADELVIMDRGEVVLAGPPNDLDPSDVRRWLTV